jgi:hypothetical protein
MKMQHSEENMIGIDPLLNVVLDGQNRKQRAARREALTSNPIR